MMSLQDRLKHVTPTAYGVRINMLRRSGMCVDDMLEDGQQEFHNEQAVKRRETTNSTFRHRPGRELVAVLELGRTFGHRPG